MTNDTHNLHYLTGKLYNDALALAESIEVNGCTDEQRSQVASVIDVLVCAVGGTVEESR